MSVFHFPRKRFVSLAVFLCFYFFIGSSFPQASQSQAKTAADLKKEGTELYFAGSYVKAIETFKQIAGMTKEPAILSQAYLYISMSYYCLEEFEESKKWLNLSLDTVPEIDSKDLIFPPGYETFYNETKAAKSPPVKPRVIVTTTDDQTKDQKIIDTRRKKKFPILPVLGAVVAVGVVVALLVIPKAEPEPTTGSIQVNSTPSGAKVFLDGGDTGKTTACTLTDVSPGSHTVKVSKDGYVDYSGSVSVTAGQTATVNATLAKNKITVTSPTASTVWIKGSSNEIRWTVGTSLMTQSNVSGAAITMQMALDQQRLLAQRMAADRVLSRYRAASALLRGDADTGQTTAGVAGRSGFRSKAVDAPSQPSSVPRPETSPSGLGLGLMAPPPGQAIDTSLRGGTRVSGARSSAAILDIAKVKIELYKGTSVQTTVSSETNNTGSFSWPVPATLPSGSDYKVRVSCSTDPTNVYGESARFTITTTGIQVNSTPTGAKVFLDGSDTGKLTNCALADVSPGSHTVKISKDGFKDYSVSATVTSGHTTTISATLVKYAITINFPLANAEVRKNTSIIVKWNAPSTLQSEGQSETNRSADRTFNSREEGARTQDARNRELPQAERQTRPGPSRDTDQIQGSQVGSQSGEARPLNITSVRIELWKGTVKQSPDIVASTPYTPGSAGTYPWTPATTLVDGKDYKIRVVAIGGTSDGTVYGESGIFSIMHWYQYVTKWGSMGSGDQQFNRPMGIAVRGNYVYVSDYSNHRITRFSTEGGYISRWGSNGSANGYFSSPWGVTTDSSGYVYVADVGNSRIQKFSALGSWAAKFGQYGADTAGSGNLFLPTGVAVSASGNIYVADAYRFRIVVFGPSGNEIDRWGSHGSGSNQFLGYPAAIALDSAGNIFVLEQQASPAVSRIHKFNSSKTSVAIWGTIGPGNGQFQGIMGLTVDSEGFVYVSDTGNNRIQKFTNNGVYVTQWGTPGTGTGQFMGPYGITIDSLMNAYVTDTSNYRVQKFRKIG